MVGTNKRWWDRNYNSENSCQAVHMRHDPRGVGGENCVWRGFSIAIRIPPDHGATSGGQVGVPQEESVATSSSAMFG